jgi:hypothetical protein
VNDSEPKPEERLFPTRSKEKIGSYLSWPAGAQSVSRALAASAQAGRIELRFSAHWPTYSRGQWPARFLVARVEYSRHRTPHRTGHWADPAWQICIHPVPRESKTVIRSALETDGFARIASWLKSHEHLHGREGRVECSLFWNSDTKSLEAEESGKALPDVIHDRRAHG